MTLSRPTVLYIAGVSRSGSTILDAMLGAHPGIVATGEINMLLRDDYGQQRVCACQKPVGECPFWGSVLHRWEKAIAPARPADYLRLEDRFERYRGLPWLLWPPIRRSTSFGDYARWTGALLRAISEIRPAEVIADSSKRAVRALALIRSGQFGISLVHLLRDPRAVMWSSLKVARWTGGARWSRSTIAVVARSGFDWILVNLVVEAIAAAYPHVPYVQVRYEDLADDPAGALRRIGAVAGVDLSSLGERAAGGEDFAFGHIMAGNRARHQGPRPLAKDIDWEENSPRWIRWTIWALTGWLARRYGYLR